MFNTSLTLARVELLLILSRFDTELSEAMVYLPVVARVGLADKLQAHPLVGFSGQCCRTDTLVERNAYGLPFAVGIVESVADGIPLVSRVASIEGDAISTVAVTEFTVVAIVNEWLA